MDPLSLLMMGSTALSGIGSILGGNRAAKASEEAARRQEQMQLQAVRDAAVGGGQFRQDVTNIAQAYNPYIQGGQKATNTLYDILGLNGADAATTARGAFQASPGFDFLMDQGVNALDRSAAARGMLGSGRQSKDLMRFGQGLASQDWRNWIGDLSNLGNQGYNATGAKVGTQVRGEEGELQGALAGTGMMFNAASTVPQGMVASASAQNQGLQGALGALNYGVGQMAGGGGSYGNLQSLLGNTSRGSSYMPSQAFMNNQWGW